MSIYSNVQLSDKSKKICLPVPDKPVGTTEKLVRKEIEKLNKNEYEIERLREKIIIEKSS